MSGTSAFFRRKCRLKSEINTPVSTPSRFIVCKFESLMREQDKILSISVSALSNSFLLMSVVRESVWDVGGCSALYFGISCFVTDIAQSHSCYTQKLGKEQTAPFQDKWLMTGGEMMAFSCNLFSDDRTFLLCFQVVLFTDNGQTSSWNFTTWCHFMGCKFPFSRFTMHSHRNRINSFGQDWRKWFLHLRESDSTTSSNKAPPSIVWHGLQW